VPLLYATWATLGVVVVVSSLLAARSARAYGVGIGALAVLFLGAGAAVNAGYLVTDTSYTGFADGSASTFVTSTWESLVVPNEWFFISLLVVFEATVGVLVLIPGRSRQVGLVLIAAFHVALVSFGWWFLVWSGPMLVAVLLLLRESVARDGGPGAQRHQQLQRRHNRSIALL
jgi:hypothetical protein